jgi:drug/metabolite transporter (DMT)-like permease
MVVLILGCGVLYYLAITFLPVTKDGAFVGVIALFVGLLTIYFMRQK